MYYVYTKNDLFLCLILYACLYACMSVSNSEPALRISLNSCILFAHIRIRRKKVRPICGKKSHGLFM